MELRDEERVSGGTAIADHECHGAARDQQAAGGRRRGEHETGGAAAGAELYFTNQEPGLEQPFAGHPFFETDYVGDGEQGVLPGVLAMLPAALPAPGAYGAYEVDEEVKGATSGDEAACEGPRAEADGE